MVWKCRRKTLNIGKSTISRFAVMFTFRNIVSEVTAGLLGPAMMWAVGIIPQGPGAGPGSERDGEPSEPPLGQSPGAQTCVSGRVDRGSG